MNYWWFVKREEEKQLSYILKFWNAAPQLHICPKRLRL